jgi:hypothetical protein
MQADTKYHHHECYNLIDVLLLTQTMDTLPIVIDRSASPHDGWVYQWIWMQCIHDWDFEYQ